MKKYKYTVEYVNSKEQTFLCNGFREAIIKATAYAYEQGWNGDINLITDEDGDTIENINLKTEYRHLNVNEK